MKLIIIEADTMKEAYIGKIDGESLTILQHNIVVQNTGSQSLGRPSQSRALLHAIKKRAIGENIG